MTFEIGSGPVTLEPGPVLPEITDPIVIDATTQPGFSGTPLVEIDGSGTSFPTRASHSTPTTASSRVSSSTGSRTSGSGLR